MLGYTLERSATSLKDKKDLLRDRDSAASRGTKGTLPPKVRGEIAVGPRSRQKATSSIGRDL